MLNIKNSCLVVLLVLLPNCIFNRSSRNYDCARAAYENVLFKYEREMAIFDSMQKTQERENKLHLMHELKDEILLKNEEYNATHKDLFGRQLDTANYPFIQYRMALDCDIQVLENARTKLYWKQEGLSKSFQDLIETLDQIRKYVVLNEEYIRERNMMERRKILVVEQQELEKQEQAKKQATKKSGKNK